MPKKSLADELYHRRVLILLLGLGVLRLIALIISPVNLHGDEAQYWTWSRQFDWGYFSKPPMIAWVIGASTWLFGNAEWAVRISSPILHPVTAYILFRTARFLYNARTGFWAAALYFTMPAVWLSSGIVSTDVVLLLFWTLALNAWAHMRVTPAWRWALLLGFAIGAGLLSKYAMLFFLPALALCVVMDAPTRRALLSKYGVAVLGLAVLLIAPNMAWNAAHDFATVSHTAANANIKGIPFHPGELMSFWGTQFGVFGPLTLVVLVMTLLANFRKKLGKETMLLSLFVISPLVIISLEALLSRANANWAVTAYMGASILVAHFGVSTWEKMTKTGIVVNIMIGSIVIFGGLVPGFANAVGQANAFKRVRGWPQTWAEIERVASAGFEGQNFSAIAVDNRLVFYDLTYYSRKQAKHPPLRMWLHTAHIDNHAEATAALTAQTFDASPVLVVNYYKDYQDELREDFARLVPLKSITIDLGGGKTRHFNMWAGYGYVPTTQTER
jgi:4-amino-4-deoxy-L-arabinose transferase-like glycosyltransferase